MAKRKKRGTMPPEIESVRGERSSGRQKPIDFEHKQSKFTMATLFEAIQ
jgi:hypothetical protein